MRFPDRERHQLFLEPEGVDSRSIYVNGYSMSLPVDVQERLVHALPGLEKARILRPGYAIEYDFVQPTELGPSLESKRLPGLFLAGQINGTSGYEEAAGQGLLAGANAGRRATGRPPVVLRRDQAYIGIMVDDLVTKGCLEPYRMFTSRAEFRLLLRIDNADLRLTAIGREAGLIEDDDWERFVERRERYNRNVARLRDATIRTPKGRQQAALALRQPAVRLETLLEEGSVQLDISPAGAAVDIASVETTLKFEGYLMRQQQSVGRAKRQETRRIPDEFPYRRVPGLSTEMVHRLEEVRPATLGQALRIPGVTPAAVAIVGAYVERHADERA